MSYWVKLRFKASGRVMTYVEKTAINREVLIEVTAPYADVIARGERP